MRRQAAWSPELVGRQVQHGLEVDQGKGGKDEAVSFFKMTNVENTFPVTRNPGGGGFGWGLELWASGQQQTSRDGQLASLSLRHAYYHPEVKIRTTKHRKYKKIEEKKAKIVKWGLGLNKEL